MTVLVNVKKNISNILLVPNKFLHAVGVTSGYGIGEQEGIGDTAYEVEFAVNVPNAVQQNAYFFNVHVFIALPESPTQNLNSGYAKTKYIKAMSKFASNLAKQKVAFLAGGASTDLSAIASPDEMRELSILKLGSKKALQSIKKIRVVQTITTKGSAFNGGNTNINFVSDLGATPGINSVPNPTYFRTLCLQSILAGADPAQAFSYNFPIDPCQTRFQRLITSELESTELLDHSPSPPRDNIRYARYQRNIGVAATGIVPLRSTMNNSLYRLMKSTIVKGPPGGQQIAQSVVGFSTRMFRIPIHFTFPSKTEKPSELYFTFEAVDIMGKIVSSTTKMCSIKPADLYPPIAVEPPVINVKRTSRNSILLGVQQKDPWANKAIIYRKIVNFDKKYLKNSSGFIKIGTVQASVDNPGFLSDQVPQGVAAIYRAMAQSATGQLGREFSSAVIQERELPSSLTFDVPFSTIPRSQIQDVVIVTRPAGKDVIVEVSGIHANAVSMFVLAEDISAAPPRNDPRHVFINPTNVSFLLQTNTANQFSYVPRLKSGGGGSHVFVHSLKSLIHDHLYQYTVHFKNMDGTITPARSKAYHHYDSFEDTGLELDVSSPMVGTIGSMATVSFMLKAGFKKNGLQETIKMFKNNEAYASFVKDIESNKENFDKLLKIGVRRIDMTNGEEFNFGPQELGKFVDNGINITAGAMPPMGGRKYRYEFTLLQASVFDLLIGTSVDVKDELTFINFKKKISKYLNAKTMKTATLLPTPDFVTPDITDYKSPNSVFEDGKTSLVIIKDVNIKTPLSTILSVYNLSVQKVGIPSMITVTWQCKLAPSMIDHFQVVARYCGMEAVIGVTHPYESKGVYSYMDTKLAGVVGHREYAIRIVYADYGVGEISKFVPMDVHTTLNMLEGIINVD